jgi:glycosyltransferase involved in cell wall biosynthesis
VRVFVWHVHGSYTTAFVHGSHEYLLPVTSDRGPNGRGRARTWDWPPAAREITREEARGAQVDVVVLQRPEELAGLAEEWLGRRPGRDVPAIYLEHSSPQGRIADMRHPAADRRDLLLAHVTHFNRLFWDAGSTATTVIEHGIVDPGCRYSGALGRAVAVINDAARRGRVTGTDLLPNFQASVPLDLFGMGAAAVGGRQGLSQERLHGVMAERRVYLHPIRWTSLGLALIEAMHLGMPVVALQTTEVSDAVPPEAGMVSNRLEVLVDALRRLVADPEEARWRGKAAREAALARFGLGRFLADWDSVLARVAR